jgi:uncharacterized delta-60 repeat protein
MKINSLLLGGLLLISTHSLAQDGVLDPTFSDNAVYALVNESEFDNELISKVAVMADGRIVMAGNIGNAGENRILVIRLLANGTRDASFGTNGAAIINVSVGNAEFFNAMALQGNKIILVGETNSSGNADMFALRLDSNGELDLTFGGLGATYIDIGTQTEDQANCVAVDANGRIIIGGSSEDPNGPNGRDLAVVRLTADGNLDNSFSDDGKLVWPVVNQEDMVKDIVLPGDGSIFLVGEAVSSGQRRIVIGALNADGSKNFSYGGANNARVIIPIDPVDGAVVYRALPEAGGVIAVFGAKSSNMLNGMMAKVGPNGALTDFSGSGVAFFGLESEIRDAVRVQNGYILVGSVVPNGETTLNGLVARVNDDADLVSTFGTNGILIEDVSPFEHDLNFGIALQGNDRAIVVGTADSGQPLGYYGYAYRISVAYEPNSVMEHAARQLAVYPNPASTLVNLPATALEGEPIVVYDLMGARVMMTSVTASRQLDISALTSGIYTLSVGMASARFVRL